MCYKHSFARVRLGQFSTATSPKSSRAFLRILFRAPAPSPTELRQLLDTLIARITRTLVRGGELIEEPEHVNLFWTVMPEIAHIWPGPERLLAT